METTTDDIKLALWSDGDDKPMLMMPVNMSRHEVIAAHGKLRETLDKGKLLSVVIKPYRQKRSLDANAYCWVLCQKLAEVLKTTKEEVYRKFIRDVGQWEIVPIKEDAVETWIRRWSGKGLGWFAEVIDDSKLDGYKKVISYYGSSVYDSREMAILIDEIVNTAQELDIETKPEAEINSLLKEWNNA